MAEKKKITEPPRVPAATPPLPWTPPPVQTQLIHASVPTARHLKQDPLSEHLLRPRPREPPPDPKPQPVPRTPFPRVRLTTRRRVVRASPR